ncbi:diguanylate cyclase [Neiella sp. HB171785]|uniref:Diguanylate cyclase n=1 Tax=Neiella litorisoli TaxID=2771431 RepID=A0A8J6QWB4_9GAMM|nr:diguanylate cyclase [Neiella litorisoli]MBD1391333.1 diguanylate cyclase [Neiella litorisoli]
MGWKQLMVLLVAIPNLCLACDLTLTHPKLETRKSELVLSLLKLALSKTEANICYQPLPIFVTDGRKAALVKKGVLSIHWASAGFSADEYVVPIKQPIFMGLTGFRIFVIRQGEQERFDSIYSLDPLKELKVGQGAFWGDTQILKRAGFSVMTATKNEALWKMLASKRFDYMPLGAHEPWPDLAIRQDMGLTVEKNILLVYPLVLYFYVAADQPELKALVERGMALALADGSYQAKLYHSEIIQAMLAQANLLERRQFYIEDAEQLKLLPPGYKMQLPDFLFNPPAPFSSEAKP